MTIRPTDLTPLQIRMLIKLDDGFDHEESVGREIGDLRPIDNLDVGAMVRMGLVVADEGRGGQLWVRRTEKGRKVRGGRRGAKVKCASLALWPKGGLSKIELA